MGEGGGGWGKEGEGREEQQVHIATYLRMYTLYKYMICNCTHVHTYIQYSETSLIRTPLGPQ